MQSGKCTSTTDRPAGGNTGRLFLAFGGPVCADQISYCPLDRVLTYKNLIYLLNLQFCMCVMRDVGLLLSTASNYQLSHFRVRVWFPVLQVGKLVFACRWSAVYSTEP